MGTIPELVTISPASPPAHPTPSLSSYTFPHHPVFCVCYPPLAILALSQLLDLSPASASLGADSTPSHCCHKKHQRALLVQASGSWWLLNQGLEFRLKNQLCLLLCRPPQEPITAVGNSPIPLRSFPLLLPKLFSVTRH